MPSGQPQAEIETAPQTVQQFALILAVLGVVAGLPSLALSQESNQLIQTTADMANSPTQRVAPFPDTLAWLVSLGAVNNNNCVTC